MSEAMAHMCGGNTIVMESNMKRGGSGHVKRATIWGRTEFPQLRREAEQKWLDPSGNRRVCNRIDAIGPDQVGESDTRYWRNWWYRGGPDWPDSYDVPLRRDVTLSSVSKPDVEPRAEPLLDEDEDEEVDSERFNVEGPWYVDW